MKGRMTKPNQRLGTLTKDDINFPKRGAKFSPLGCMVGV